MRSTSYYNQHSDRLFKEYSALNSDDVHAHWTREILLNREPGLACDIGAGPGRDAHWLAEQGWEVTAVEPSELRQLGEQKAHPRINWLDDSLPDLKNLEALQLKYDLILLSAVWQHVQPNERRRVFRKLCDLLKPSGALVISVRKSDDASEQRERGFHEVTSDELIHLANQHAVSHRLDRRDLPDLTRAHVHWDWQAFEMPDDGTGNLPLLRHIIVNDNKSSSYKLGLLRTLVKLAETAPGVVTRRTDDYVEIPFGAVGLYWLKLYQPLLLQRDLRQLPGSVNPGFARNAFKQLKHIAPSDLSLGYRFDADRADIIRRAIADTCQNIKKMPAHFITYPGDSTQQVFECDYTSVSKKKGSISLSKGFLSQFGTFRIPAQLWQTFGQFACWLDPAIVREWRQLILPWQTERKLEREDDHAFEWGVSERETNVVTARAQEVRETGFPLTCIWSAKRISQRTKLEIDHCFPWSRWPNNDLWNLLPTRADINQQKRDRLPAAETLTEAQERIVDWWKIAWVDSPCDDQFFMEAGYSLPGLTTDRPTLEVIHQATKHQRVRLKQDLQVPEWLPLNQAISDQ